MDEGSKRMRRNATLEAILPRREPRATLYGELKVRFRRDFPAVAWVITTGRGGRIEAESPVCFPSGNGWKRSAESQTR